MKELRVGYPLPKIDIIGVECIDAIAMENWGTSSIQSISFHF
jgi:aminopeptidase N